VQKPIAFVAKRLLLADSHFETSFAMTTPRLCRTSIGDQHGMACRLRLRRGS
jgi:hypothetical protein